MFFWGEGGGEAIFYTRKGPMTQNTSRTYGLESRYLFDYVHFLEQLIYPLPSERSGGNRR